MLREITEQEREIIQNAPEALILDDNGFKIISLERGGDKVVYLTEYTATENGLKGRGKGLGTDYNYILRRLVK